MFLHCHDCGWSQDDFYSKNGYNPTSFLSSWNEALCSNKIDEQFTKDAEFLREHGPISLREVIAQEYEKYAKRIRSMKWITREQWQADPDKWKCPQCGKQMDID